MKEKNTPLITEVGKIYGRDAIFLKKINFISESEIEISGFFNGILCSNLGENNNLYYKITFKGINLFKMIELDYHESNYESSFDIVENSNTLQNLIDLDKKNIINKIDSSYKHYIFTTYDTVFEFICKNFELKTYTSIE